MRKIRIQKTTFHNSANRLDKNIGNREEMRIHLTLSICLLVTLSFACTPVSSHLEKSQEPEVEILKEEKKVELESEGNQETVVIEGKEYQVPDQWQGRKILAPSLSFPELTKIPESLSYKQSKLFMLDAANQALQEMAEEADKDQVQLLVHSSYRSIWFQRKIFMRRFQEGHNFEDIVRYVAPPGYSEHALGTVVDFYPSDWRFADVEAYAWLKQNGSRYHFFESYPEHGEPGLAWEAWHWRWIPPES